MMTAENNTTAKAPKNMDAAAVPLARRLQAAQIDMAVIGACALALLLLAGPMVAVPHPLWPAVAIVTGVIIAVEVLLGVTPGKLLTRLYLRSRDSRRLAAPPWYMTALRGFVRQAPIMIFGLSLFLRDQSIGLTVFFASIVLACCYLSGCYITFMRTGMTLFDLVAGTKLVSRAR